MWPLREIGIPSFGVLTSVICSFLQFLGSCPHHVPRLLSTSLLFFFFFFPSRSRECTSPMMAVLYAFSLTLYCICSLELLYIRYQWTWSFILWCKFWADTDGFPQWSNNFISLSLVCVIGNLNTEFMLWYSVISWQRGWSDALWMRSDTSCG